MIYASIHTRHLSFVWVFVERDEVPAARRVEEHHAAAVAEPLLEPEDALVERQGAVKVSNHKVDVCQALRRSAERPASRAGRAAAHQVPADVRRGLSRHVSDKKLGDVPKMS